MNPELRHLAIAKKPQWQSIWANGTTRFATLDGFVGALRWSLRQLSFGRLSVYSTGFSDAAAIRAPASAVGAGPDGFRVAEVVLENIEDEVNASAKFKEVA